ncbi:MAG: nucleotide sugar dehydrogenase [Candidatus Marinimicrobia bacterium]|nr:nucleotide sugar dehydrogenase [Candidatus Neomarinimicrobiota bacterium]
MIKIKNNAISIIGGAGHVGFPLGLAFASKNIDVQLIDKNLKSLKKIMMGKIPFMELGAKKLLKQCLNKKKIKISNNLNSIHNSKYIVICIGTPINTKLQPDFKGFFSFLRKLKKKINHKQILIVRSSIYPGVIAKIEKILKNKNKNIVYCPERIVQGYSLDELPKLPQIISSNNNETLKEVKKLFKRICLKIIVTKVTEAELIKLFSNANRYINFSIANQFFLMSKSLNLDFSRIRNIMQDGYERNLNLAKSGFTAGPCLLKDTMQLSSFFKKNFNLGHAAMEVNEGMPHFVIKEIKKIKNYRKKKIGILGLAFKPNNDDIRDSLAIKLLKKLKSMKLNVLQSDDFYKNANNLDKKLLIKKSDIIIIGAPHNSYKTLKIPKNKNIIDVWG